MDIGAFRIFTEPQQGASYDDLLAVARHAEALGFDGFFRSDHYLKMGGVSGLPGPTDALVTLAGLARDTTKIRLGTLVCSATFRHAGVLGISVAEIDNMSGGRMELGLGAGWYGQEHDANGIPFPPLGRRFDTLEDQLAVITRMWATPEGQTFDYDGKTLSIKGSPGLPKPTQRPHPPIIIGGQGQKRTPMLAATYANEFNRAFAPVENFAALSENVRGACRQIGRDPASLVYSVAQVAAVGRDEAEFRRRAAAIGRQPDEVRANGAAGTVTEAAARLRHYVQAGAQRIYLQILDLHDLDHLDLLATEVIPAV
jgi:F420-dependent oxidoreductase-like protein